MMKKLLYKPLGGQKETTLYIYILICYVLYIYEGGLKSLWLYKENKKLWD
jgi:hypothetical protein